MEVSDADGSSSVRNRFGAVETVLKADFENNEFEKLIDLGGDNNKYYFNYET
jgi:hypothetical protein